VASVTYLDDNEEATTGVAVAATTVGSVGGCGTIGNGTVTSAVGGGVGVPTDYIGRTVVLWSLSTDAQSFSTAARPALYRVFK
jgi:hypothetical protein